MAETLIKSFFKTLKNNGGTYAYKLWLDIYKTGDGNIVSNATPIKITFRLESIYSYYEGMSGPTAEIQIYTSQNPKWVSVKTEKVPSIGNKKTIIMASYTADIPHKPEGTLTINVKGIFSGTGSASYMPNTSGDNGTVTSETLSLPTIPRATSFSDQTLVIEEAKAISITPASSSFKHRIVTVLGGITSYFPSQTGFFSTSQSVTLSAAHYEKVTGASLNGTITLYTYDSAGNLLGSSAKTLYASCSKDRCSPVLGSHSVVDTNSVTTNLSGNSSILILNASNAKLTLTATLKNYAKLSSLTINGVAVTPSSSTSGGTTTLSCTVTYNKISTNTFTINLVDSRGLTASTLFSVSSKTYVPLTLSAKIERISKSSDSKVRLTYSGNYFNASFGKTANTLSIRWAVRKKGSTSWTSGGTLTPTKSSNTYSNGSSAVELSNPLETDKLFNYQDAYEFIVYATDKILTDVNTGAIPMTRGIPNFEIYEGAILFNGIVLFYDETKFTQKDDGSFAKK